MAFGPLSGPLHLRRSKLARWPLASAAQYTPLRSTSPPRGEKPGCLRIVERRLVDFGQRGVGRIRSRVQPNHGARESELRAPHRSVGRGRHRVERAAEALVLRRIERLIGLDVLVTPAVAVGVEDERRPALRLRLVAGLFEHLAIQPADHLAAAARPQRVVGVLGKHQMVRAEAGADVRELLRLRIPHREMASRALDREQLRRRMIRARLAEVRIVRRPHGRSDPHAALLVEHRVVHVVAAASRSLRCPNTARAPASSARSAACWDRAPSAAPGSWRGERDRAPAGSRRSTRARRTPARWR